MCCRTIFFIADILKRFFYSVNHLATPESILTTWWGPALWVGIGTVNQFRRDGSFHPCVLNFGWRLVWRHWKASEQTMWWDCYVHLSSRSEMNFQSKLLNQQREERKFLFEHLYYHAQEDCVIQSKAPKQQLCGPSGETVLSACGCLHLDHRLCFQQQGDNTFLD